MLDKNVNPNTGESAIKRIKERNMLKKQRLAIVLMVAAIALLVVALLVVNYLVQIYSFEDNDGTKYQIKKVNGIYALCYKGDGPCDRNSDGYYQTDLGTLVQIDPATGEAALPVQQDGWHFDALTQQMLGEAFVEKATSVKGDYTKYGIIPEEYSNTASYPFALFTMTESGYKFHSAYSS